MTMDMKLFIVFVCMLGASFFSNQCLQNIHMFVHVLWVSSIVRWWWWWCFVSEKTIFVVCWFQKEKQKIFCCIPENCQSVRAFLEETYCRKTTFFMFVDQMKCNLFLLEGYTILRFATFDIDFILFGGLSL